MKFSICVAWAVLASIFVPVSPVSAFLGASDSLRCRKDKVEQNVFGKMWYSGGPIWDLRVEIFDNQVALTRIIDNEGGNVDIMPAVVNRGYVQFQWDWAPHDPGLLVNEVTVDRRRKTLTIFWDGSKAGSPRWNRYVFKCKPE